jgi:predicted RNase H-like nuclease (RuvC/YqgF family)
MNEGRHMKHLTLRLILVGITLAVATQTGAQTARSGGGASAQQLQQLQQLASERTALQNENGKLKAELDKLRKENEAIRRDQKSAEQRNRSASASTEAAVARGAAETERLQADLARERQRMQELVDRFKETANSLRDVEMDRTGVRQTLVERERALKVCVDRNQALYALNGEVLTKFEDQGFWSALARREPFTQLKRVQLENLVDGYRAAAQDQVVTP